MKIMGTRMVIVIIMTVLLRELRLISDSDNSDDSADEDGRWWL